MNSKKNAAQTIEGPVQVIAGPGTGKTQILASRIANILATTDTDPWNILCLTFTDAGAIAMRDRLLKFIGPTAHQVQIHTFHSLCNQIIQDNQAFFGTNSLSPIDDIESEQLIRTICEMIKPEAALYNPYDAYSFKYALKAAFGTFKKENLSSDQLIKNCDALIKDLENDESLRYTTNRKGKWEKGDLKVNDYNKAKKKLEKIKESALLFSAYTQKMQEMQRYDFDDMILWVLEAFDKHPDLLLDYQEQFQYMLTDEFQDTNGAQFKLIELLMNHWDSPNIFSVGDDDQSIYAFQGANVANMLKFGKSFSKGLNEFVLSLNYRSSPEILAASEALIQNNVKRLIHERPHLNKVLIAKKVSNHLPIIATCQNPLQESAWVTSEIEKQIQSGVAANEIAVLYNNHRFSDKTQRLLQAKGIEVNLHRSDNLFDIELIAFLIRALKYVAAELDQPFSGEPELFKLLHAPCFNMSSLTLAEKAFEMGKKKGKHKFWRKALQVEEPTLFDAAPLRQAMQKIESWIKFASDHSPLSLLSKILNETDAIQQFGKPGKNHLNINAISTLFNFVKERNEKIVSYTVHHCIKELEILRQGNGIKLVNDIKTEAGVNFVSIHSAKGLEFKHVYVLANTKQNWDRSRSSGTISMRPLFGNVDEKIAQVEETRRLLYVAMTRAEESLTLTYYEHDDKGKSTSESSFVSELLDSGTVEKQTISVPQNQMVDSSLGLIQNPEIKIELPDASIIDAHLANYTLSATHMNRYLKCPIAFYYENLLRVPSTKSEAGCIGTAVHDALNYYFKNYKDEEQLPSPMLLMSCVERKMNEQYIYFNKATFDKRLQNTKSYLLAYYERKKAQWQSEKIFSTEKNLEAVIGATRIKGFLDKLVFDGNSVHVIDYKTGNPKNAISKMKGPDFNYEGEDITKKYGGEYWRQLMFYHFLVNYDNRNAWKMESAAVSCVEKDRDTGDIIDDINLVPDMDGLELMESLIKDTFSRIKSRQFDVGCGKTNERMAFDNCEWCQFHSKRG